MSRFDSNVNVDTDAALIPLQSTQASRRAPLLNPAVAVGDLGVTVSNPPTQAEVQSIADKMDELLAALRSSGQVSP